MDGVLSGRVHVSYDIDSGETGRASAPVHLSALVNYQNEADPSLLISDIKRFLKNSFTQVDYDNISVVLSKQPALQHQSPMENRGANSGGFNRLLPMAGGVLLLVVLAVGLFYWRKAKIAPTDRVAADENNAA